MMFMFQATLSKDSGILRRTESGVIFCIRLFPNMLLHFHLLRYFPLSPSASRERCFSEALMSPFLLRFPAVWMGRWCPYPWPWYWAGVVSCTSLEDSRCWAPSQSWFRRSVLSQTSLWFGNRTFTDRRVALVASGPGEGWALESTGKFTAVGLAKRHEHWSPWSSLSKLVFVSFVGSLVSLCPSWLFLLPGCGHHSDAGKEDASFSVASLWYLWLRVWLGEPLVLKVRDSVYVKPADGVSESESNQEMSWDCNTAELGERGRWSVSGGVRKQ